MSYKLDRMTPDDAPLTVEWMVRQYGFDKHEVETWVKELHFDWPLSVKAIDDNGNAIGLLNMSGYRVEEETNLISTQAPKLLDRINTLNYTAVFSFIVANEWRGTRLNFDMIMEIMPDMKKDFDFVFIPVMHRLKTHNYWMRWGATEFFRDNECVYYMLPFTDAAMETARMASALGQHKAQTTSPN